MLRSFEQLAEVSPLGTKERRGRNWSAIVYDLIGDSRGHANELAGLLDALGYVKSGAAYRHPNRKVVFLGDVIDRGPQIWRVLEIVRSMVEAGHA